MQCPADAVNEGNQHHNPELAREFVIDLVESLNNGGYYTMPGICLWFFE